VDKAVDVGRKEIVTVFGRLELEAGVGVV